MKENDQAQIDEQKIDKFYLDRLLTHRKVVSEREFYNLQRLDVIIVTLATGGIVLTYNLLRYGKENTLDLCYPLLAFGGIVFAISICSNILSQITGAEANEHESNRIEEEIAKERKKDYSESNFIKHASKRDCNNKLTSMFNRISAVLLFLGILLVIVVSSSLF